MSNSIQNLQKEMKKLTKVVATTQLEEKAPAPTNTDEFPPPAATTEELDRIAEHPQLVC